MDNTLKMLYIYHFRDHTTYYQVRRGILYYDDLTPQGFTWREDVNSPLVDFLLKHCIMEAHDDKY